MRVMNESNVLIYAKFSDANAGKAFLLQPRQSITAIEAFQNLFRDNVPSCFELTIQDSNCRHIFKKNISSDLSIVVRFEEGVLHVHESTTTCEEQKLKKDCLHTSYADLVRKGVVLPKNSNTYNQEEQSEKLNHRKAHSKWI